MALGLAGLLRGVTPLSGVSAVPSNLITRALGASFGPSLIRTFAAEPGDQLALKNTGAKAGFEGRSSVSGVTATIFGGYGFIGSYIVNEFAKRGSQVVVPFRSTENRVQHIKQMGDLGQVVMLQEFDISDEEMVKYAISRSNVVINLIGQRLETMNYTFDDVHVKWPERLAKIVAASPQVERLIHFSEMGADESHASRRLASKAKGDALLMQHVPSATIVRPGPVVGIEDHFYNLMIYQLSFGLLAPVYDGGPARLQPTWVRDVSEATFNILKRGDTKGKTLYLAGPETLTVRQVYDKVIETLRLRVDDTVHVPKAVAKAILGPLNAVRRAVPALPMDNYTMSTDYVEEMTRDRVAPRGALGYAELGIKPAKVTDGLAIEPVRHFRVGGYRWGDMAKVAKDVPEAIRRYYNIK